MILYILQVCMELNTTYYSSANEGIIFMDYQSGDAPVIGKGTKQGLITHVLLHMLFLVFKI